MADDTAAHDGPHSPFDPYIGQAMTLIATRTDTPYSGLSELCVRELQWLPGFSDVIINILRANGLVQYFEWEPGRVHISDRGQRWILAGRESITVK